MKKNLLLATVLALSATGAMAQTKFDGFYGQAGIGYESVKPSNTFTLNGKDVSSLVVSDNANSFAAQATVGYTFALNKSFVVGLGVDYLTPGQSQDIKIGSNRIGSYKKKNAFNVFVAPGMVIGENGLAYAKLGYSGATFEGQNNTSDNYSGYLVGLGYKQIIAGSLYAFGEVNYNNYGSVSATATNGANTVKASMSFTSTNLLVGAGYKF